MEIAPRILICDDEPLMTESLKRILGEDRYRIQTTNTASHALTLIHAESPDLVILDIIMPGMNGFEVLDAVDRDQCHPDFIIITGHSTVDSAIKAIRKGASEYLKKPFEPDELIVRVETILKQREKEREHLSVMAEKRQLEEKLRQSQKMEAIGTLAGGIAHDFNNILSIILGNTELAMADTNRENSVHKNLEQILEASLRAREMIQQLLNFSRMEENGRHPILLNNAIENFLKLMRASLPARIVIEKEICKEKCAILADETQIDQVMMNLCTNAFHAMEKGGGVLTVRLDCIKIDRKETVEKTGLVLGSYARLVISDTGHGIEPDIIERIFDPYFTTKERGKGTGMGLSLVHGIVKGNGGAINVFSRPGRYTEFHLYFPVIDTCMTCENEKPDCQPTELPSGDEHILIVDDETMLLEMMQKMLQQLGYTVTALSDSPQALRCFLSTPSSYDLVITDLNMPNMTGLELAKAITAERPNTPILLCTGYNERISEEKIKICGIHALMMKPVGMKEMADTIRRALCPSVSERRRTPRHNVLPGVFIISKTFPYERCRLLDISPVGLAFQHDMEPTPPQTKDELAILTPDGQLFASDLCCRVISDTAINPTEPHARRSNRRRGACFEGLSASQREQIERFIDLHTKKTIH